MTLVLVATAAVAAASAVLTALLLPGRPAPAQSATITEPASHR